jgi:hypothetical protein
VCTQKIEGGREQGAGAKEREGAWEGVGSWRESEKVGRVQKRVWGGCAKEGRRE